MPELFADGNGIKICYEIYGDGYPVILIHGFGTIKENWMCQIGALSEKFKVIIFDNRGAGKSDRPNIPYTMDMYVEDTKALMDVLKIDKAHIVGWSLGGMIVQNFILKYPELVNKVVLINTFSGFPNEQGLIMYKNGLIERYYAILKDPVKAFFDHSSHKFTRKFRNKMLEDPRKKFYGLFSAEDLINKNSTNLATPQDIKNGANAIAKHNVIDRLHMIKNETLILTADKDRISPKVANEEIHKRIKNSILKVINNARHDSPFEKAPEVNQAIVEFLLD
ncbi:MAG: alpha/beta fold hydrolase [Promethearchaeota archaeon]